MTTAIAEQEPETVTPRRRYDDRFVIVLLDQLVESGHNPRRYFDEAKLQELAQSIRERGIVEPLVVRPLIGVSDDDADSAESYEIVAGARRFRAAKLAELTRVPCVVRDYGDRDVLELFVIENTQRDDLDPLEEAAGYKQLLLVDQTYTPAMIAQRIGHTERYVFDRMRLLDLIPELQAHLTAGRIGVEHAEVLAKLKPAEQKTAAHPDRGALFEHDYALKFDDQENPFRFKVRSVRQLKEWIARHIRFDVEHAAKTAPLEFAATAQRVSEASAQPGRGKKVVPITFDTMCPQGAKDDNERTYGASAWKRAEGKDRQPTCEHAVLGLVVAGEQYGASFHVCIARDRCTTHWKAEVEAKAKAEKLRADGKGKQAASVETKARQKTENSWEREQELRRAREAAWAKLEPHVIAEVVDQVKGAKVLTAAQAKHFVSEGFEFGFDTGENLPKHLGSKWYEKPAAALLVLRACAFYGDTFDEYVKQIAKPLGLNIKRLESVRDKHAPKAEAAAAPAKKKAGKKR